MQAYEIKYYQDEKGSFPAHEWLHSLKDKKTRGTIKGRIQRLKEGNFGYISNLGDGILELKIDYGPGYRVYLGTGDKNTVIIFAIGNKKTQTKDIIIARTRREKYWERKNEKKRNKL